MAEIVRDVTETHQGLTTTGPYIAPHGGEVFIGAANDALGTFLSNYGKGSKGSGSGSDKDLAGAYKYVADQTNYLDSVKTGPSEKQDIFDKTWATAQRVYGVTAGDLDAIYKDTGMSQYGQVPKDIRQEKLDIETLQAKNTLRVGTLIDPYGSLDSQMQKGSEALARLANAEVSVRNLSAMTPEQQKEALTGESDNTIKKTLRDAITDSWAMQYADPNMQSIPEEAALMSFKDNMTQLIQTTQKVDPVTARAFVDNATMAQQIQIYGKDYLTNTKGLEFYRDKALKAYNTTEKIQEADLLNQMLDMDFEDVTTFDGTKVGTIKGRALYALIQGDGGAPGSLAGLLKALDPKSAMNIMGQLHSKTRDRWKWSQMRLVLSDQGATILEFMKGNKDAGQGMADGFEDAFNNLINDYNKMSSQDKAAKDAYWIPSQKFVDSFTRPDGVLVSREAIDSAYTPQMKQQAKENFFKAAAVGSNSSTVDPDFFSSSAGGFYQISEDGSLRYYGLAGNRMENITTPLNVFTSWATGVGGRQAVELKDLTNAGRVIGTGDQDAVRMREGMPVILRGLDILEKSFGYDRKALINEFNDYQIRNTIGGQKARSVQLLNKNKKGSSYRDLSQTMEMTDRDVRAVQDEVKALRTGREGLWEGSGVSASAADAIREGTLEAASTVGRIPGAAAVGAYTLAGEAAKRSLEVPGQLATAGVNLLREPQKFRLAGVDRNVKVTTYPETDTIQIDENGETILLTRQFQNISDVEKIVKDQLGISEGYLQRPGLIHMPFRGSKGIVEAIQIAQNATGDNRVIIKDDKGDYHTYSGSNLEPQVQQGDTVSADQIVAVSSKKIKEKKYTAEQARNLFRVNPSTSSQENTSVSNFEYKGNIDLENRPVVTNEDGSISTEYSIVIEEDGEFVVIPTVVNGQVVSEEDAIENYHNTGKHLGMYKTLKEAEKASRDISKIQSERYLK